MINIKEMIKEYIKSEIMAINTDLVVGNDDSLMQDLIMLRQLKEEDINDIVKQIKEDYKLQEMINETIHYYLYEKK